MAAIKYRIHEVGKDFGKSSKVVLELLTEYFDDTKNHMTALTDKELDVIFETFTQQSAVKSFDEYFATAAETKSEPKKEAPRLRKHLQRLKRRSPKQRKQTARNPRLKSPRASLRQLLLQSSLSRPRRRRKTVQVLFRQEQRAKREQSTPVQTTYSSKSITSITRISCP